MIKYARHCRHEFFERHKHSSGRGETDLSYYAWNCDFFCCSEGSEENGLGASVGK